LAKMEQEFQANGLPGQERPKNLSASLPPQLPVQYLAGLFRIITMFLTFCTIPAELTWSAYPEDLEAFLEHEQDRSLKPSTVRPVGSGESLYSFSGPAEVVRPEVLSRSIKIKVPELLPKAMDPEDVKRLLAVVSKVRIEP